MSARPHRVVIAGGGAAGLEALLALRALAGHRVDITLVAREREFLYRPVTVAEPFDRGQARSFALREILDQAGGGELIWDSLARVDPDQHAVQTGSGRQVRYDSLIVATGAVAQCSLPGALTFDGRGAVPAMRRLLDQLACGSVRSVAFTLPSPRMWTLPIYELALLTAIHLREYGSAAQLRLVTPEEEPLELFGPTAARAIGEYLRARDIWLHTSSRPAEVRGRALVLMGGAKVFVDGVVTLPELVGPHLAGLPTDTNGFIPVDTHGQVADLTDVYAAGDITSFPLKQGGLATQQADAVAELIAARLGVPIQPSPFRPVLRGLLITGGAPLYLRAEAARLPRAATVAIDARPLRPVTSAGRDREVSAAADEPLWWPPAKIAGRYLASLLASARPEPLSAEPLADRVVPAGVIPANEAEYEDALELALLLAECDARWGDYGAALSALDAAQALGGSLPPEYEAKARQWRRPAGLHG